MAKELGTANAIISSINTLKDGSVKVSLEMNPDDQKLINQLISAYLNNNKLVTVAFVQCE